MLLYVLDLIGVAVFADQRRARRGPQASRPARRHRARAGDGGRRRHDSRSAARSASDLLARRSGVSDRDRRVGAAHRGVRALASAAGGDAALRRCARPRDVRVAGAQIAERAGVPAVACVVLGTITGSAGGAVRDVLSAEIPLVLRRGNLYASAAILGIGVYFVLVRCGRASRGWRPGPEWSSSRR